VVALNVKTSTFPNSHAGDAHLGSRHLDAPESWKSVRRPPGEQIGTCDALPDADDEQRDDDAHQADPNPIGGSSVP